MFTQKETRMNIELVQNKYKPIITHDMHQQGGDGSRIFVPPFTEPFDPNMHPLLRMQQNTVGQAMAHALLVGRQGRRGVGRPATTCGRRRASTWSTTASRAS